MLCSVLALGAALAGCREADPAQTGTENPAVTTPVEMPTSAGETGDQIDLGADGPDIAAPGFVGSTSPSLALDLGEGVVCYVYAGHVVRVAPRGRAGDIELGQDVETAPRPDGAGPTELCEGAGLRRVSTDGRPDAFMGLEGDLLILDRGTDSRGRTLRVVDLADGDRLVLDTRYEEPVELADGALRYGREERRTRTADTIGDDIECPNAESFVESGLEIAILRVVAFDLDAREATETDRYVCMPLE